MKKVYMNMNPNEIESEYLNGVYNEITNSLGIEVAMTLYSTYRGQQITFPVNFFTTDFITSRIVAEYDSKKIRQLATKYCYSEKWIRQMIKENKAKTFRYIKRCQKRCIKQN